jgi:DNA (cytosine-5)-methyltransferase 1
VLPHIRQVKHGGAPENWKSSNTPNPTVVASGGSVSPSAYLSGGSFIRTFDGVERRYTIAEIKKLSGFPDDFALLGDFEQQWERMGRAVPPVMMLAVAAAIQQEVLDVIKRRS